MSQPVDGIVDIVVHEDNMSSLISLHACADAFQLLEFNKALHKTKPGGKLARLFRKDDVLSTPSVTLDQMLMHQLEPLPAPLLHSGGKFRSSCLHAFSAILKFSEDRCLTMDAALETAQSVLRLGMGQPFLRDEIFMQIFKQTRNNEETSSRFQLWQLFHVFAATVPPSKEFVPLLSQYIQEVIHNDSEDSEIKRKASKTWKAMKRSIKTGGRKWLPSSSEIKALLTDRKLKTDILFCDETGEDVEFDISTTVLEAVEQIASLIDLEHYHTFSLFEVHESEDRGIQETLLDDQKYIADILSDLESHSDPSGYLLFKKRMFRTEERQITDSVFVNLSYIQVQRDYLKNHYPVQFTDAAKLCALQLFVEFGNSLPGEDKVLKKAIEKFTTREVKRLGMKEAWKAEVLLNYHRLHCRSKDIARLAFLSMIRSLPYGLSVFFYVSRTRDPMGLLPPRILLGVNTQGIHLFRPVPLEFFHTTTLQDIRQFGAGFKTLLFKMRVNSNLRDFEFETRQGEDICMALQNHINETMAKRYETLTFLPKERLERSVEDKDVEVDIERAKMQKQLQRDVHELQETRQRTMFALKEKMDLQETLSRLRSDVQSLETELERFKIEPVVEPGPSVRREMDPSLEEEQSRLKEREDQLNDEVRLLLKQTQNMKQRFAALVEEKAVVLHELKDVLEEVVIDHRTRLHRETMRETALERELEQAKQCLATSRSELERLQNERREMEALRLFKAQMRNQLIQQADEAKLQRTELKELEMQYHTAQLDRKLFFNKVEDMKGKIRVCARVRCVLPREAQNRSAFVLEFPDDMTLRHSWKREPEKRSYVFDRVYRPSSGQKDIFESAKDLIQSTLDGTNVCIFAYGQTGSGKTYTIYGQPNQPGLAPQSIEHLFALIRANSAKFRFRVTCYMLELYQDCLMDLLRPKTIKNDAWDVRPVLTPHSSDQRLQIKRDCEQMIVVSGATVLEMHSAEELITTFEEGHRHRHVAETQLNIASSRSHLIMSIIVEATDLQTRAQTRGKLSFIDLAGSERVKKSQSAGEQLKEAQAINKSLSALGDVISSLAKGSSYVPYRNHKLTMLMSDSLGGNAKTLMFITVSPAESNLDETQNALQYGTRVRTIKCSSSKTAKEIQALKKRIAFWKHMAAESRPSEVRQLFESFL